uniref:Uncharacterized protein n=1 Tax=Alexandrium monilatum TaxID=311494 RepID=A0A7S4Q808_9DINO
MGRGSCLSGIGRSSGAAWRMPSHPGPLRPRSCATHRSPPRTSRPCQALRLARRGAAHRTAKEERDPELRAGALVRVAGLQQAAELNGRQGRLLEIDEASGRWHVDVLGEAGAVRKAIRPENLQAVREAPALAGGRAARPKPKARGKAASTPAAARREQ